MQDIIAELKKRLQGEVRFDKISRILYSTDASIYEIEPLGVVIPKSPDDIQATIEVAAKNRIPIIPRGAGTSLVGGSIGAGIIVDCSKYLNRILEINQEEKWARIQPGVVLDQLNHFVKPFDLCFGPDTATSSRANLGGLIGNNSSGARSIFYGKTIDHVLELKALLSTAETVELKPVSPAELSGLSKRQDLLGTIYRVVAEIAAAHSDEINRRFPKILRRVSGYNLDAFVDGSGFDLAKMVVGSEGTLAFVTEARVNLEPRPKERVLGVVHFSQLSSALEAVQPILEFKPSAVELIDDLIIKPTRETQEYARRMTFVRGDPKALLIVEFQGDSKADVVDRLTKMTDSLKRARIGYAHIMAVDEDEQADVWYIRKAGLGLLQGMKGARRPIGFVEDTAVPTEKLPEYIQRFEEIVQDHQTEACYYAHASVGCLHIRPLLNLKSRKDIQRMESLAEAVSDLVLEFGGAMSGEHGDGLARSCFNEKMFGAEIYQAFKEIKKAFDPKNIFNPGKIVDAPGLTENLRAPTLAEMKPFETFLDFSHEGGFEAAIEICNGNGVCRKSEIGTMCPSYMATRDERDSTRGRANALRAVLSGRLQKEQFFAPELKAVLDLCVSCKGCKGECPTNVDMAKLKYEFLYQYHQVNGLPVRDRLFGHIDRINKLGCLLAPVLNWIGETVPARWLLQALVGITCSRKLPPFAKPTFVQWFRSRQQERVKSSSKVVLFNDTFMTYNYPNVGKSAVKILEAAGYEVLLAQKKRCCGRPYLSRGMLAQARECAAANLQQLHPFVEAGIPIVGCEPSCILTFRDEYRDLLTDSRLSALAENSYLIEEFLSGERAGNTSELHFMDVHRKVLVHGHCHAKALMGVQPILNLLNFLPNVEVESVDSGCCGMAGSFGFEREHYLVSMAMGGRLFDAVKHRDGSWQIVAPGVSCRQQIRQGTGREAKHPIEVLAENLIVDLADGS